MQEGGHRKGWKKKAQRESRLIWGPGNWFSSQSQGKECVLRVGAAQP